MMFFARLNKRTRIVLVLQSVSMLLGSSTHINWILKNGIFSQQENTLYASTVFWDSLAFFDLLAALLLIIKPKAGIVLTAIIITADVIHNNSFWIFGNLQLENIDTLLWVMFAGQIIFFVFVYSTLKTTLVEINLKAKSLT
jgi:hypothetical protein